jgi:phenylacetate-coenzyme A ligase PaaK-like adenylate-forming protein
MNINNLFDIKPYSLKQIEKEEFFNSYLYGLTQHHYENCNHYKSIIDSLGFDTKKKVPYTDLPFLPVRLFKMYELYSVAKVDIIKTMTSSGTSGQEVSKIFLDKDTSHNQSKAVTKILSEFIGSKRTPMVIIDSPLVLNNRNMLSARGAGILGFSMFGTKRIFALKESMELDTIALTSFIDEHRKSRIFLFGFTFMVYQHFVKELSKKNIKIDLSNAVLIHGGGWKKLQNQSITSKDFRAILNQICGLEKVHDYYGMIEQTGSIYMECEYRNLHAPVFSDIIIRNPHDFSLSSIGEQGIIQTLSVLPNSYPGHSLLTEDEGVLLGEDDCLCGRLGKYFHIIGRIKNAEIRGCSDTYADQF